MAACVAHVDSAALTFELNKLKKSDIIDILVNRTVLSNVHVVVDLDKHLFETKNNRELNISATKVAGNCDKRACTETDCIEKALELEFAKKEVNIVPKLSDLLEARINDQAFIVDKLFN
ncbi:hypothetical protein QE152_g27282 [Popillia japonica]|uniref:Uncharacterized protein n=1 Tax=Popillia japonica TaxID=7064 RepID=A0AAW1JWV4_POPJA